MYILDEIYADTHVPDVVVKGEMDDFATARK